LNKIKGLHPDVIYISSNHASHVQYAVQFLEYGCDVFIEKPIAINTKQLNMLTDAVNKTTQNIYVGYNRPHSPALKIIKDYYINDQKPFTLSCFVSGHFIPEDHWYRDKSEGTRVVSNLGHWLDLSIYILSWSSTLPEYLDVTITYSDINMPSDNIAIAMTSSNHDLINITFTSRGEPFEGVSEMINFQKDNLNAQIEDYRVTKIWKDSSYKKYKHWPKNNGHKKTVLQPFGSAVKREWSEIELSTRLMLHVEGMVVSNLIKKRFNL
jgi:predicted dehydrogenase